MSQSVQSSGRCPKCGADISSSAPKAVCPRCALEEALGNLSGGERDTQLSLTDLTVVDKRAAGQAGVHLPQSADSAGDRRQLRAERIGRYKLLEKIGEGGCGVVYVAEQQEPVRRRVALKVIKLGMDTREFIARFEAERQALALMDHPNIAKVLDAGATESGRPFFVMELVKGTPITRYCDENGLHTQERLKLFIQVCHAIQHAHQKGIIHRDIKPSNILVADHDGVAVPKVIDFGIAKATTNQPLTDKTLYTAINQFIGTPAYMSPEQARLSGLDIDTRSDIYSLGVLLYELISGQTPFEMRQFVEAGLDEIRRIIREDEPLRPSARLSTLDLAEQTEVARRRRSEPHRLLRSMRGDLDWIVMKCLEKERGRRYESASALGRDLQNHLDHQPVLACPPSWMYQGRKLVRRHKLAFIAGVAIAVTLILGMAGIAFEAKRQNAEARRADANAAAESRQRLKAEQEARRAEAAELEARKAASQSDFLEASHLIEKDRANMALPYLGRSLLANPANGPSSRRLATLLAYRTWRRPPVVLKTARDNINPGWFTPDGRGILSISEDRTARIWDVRTGQPLTVPIQLEEAVESVQFNTTGDSVLITTPGYAARLYETKTGRWVGPSLKLGEDVTVIQLSPDGTRIATGSTNGIAQIVDAHSGLLTAKQMGHSRAIRAVQFSRDGKRIATGSEDRTACVWDAQTGEPVTAPLSHEGTVNGVEFSPDGKQLITIYAFDLLNGATLQHAGVPVAFTDLKRDSAQLWNIAAGLPMQGKQLKCDGHVSSARFSSDGTRVLVVSDTRKVYSWEAGNGQPSKNTLVFTNADSVLISANGDRILTLSHNLRGARLWDGADGRPLTEEFVHEYILNAQLSPDGTVVSTAAWGGGIGLWSSDFARIVPAPMKHADTVRTVRFSPDGKQMVTAADDKTACLWDIATGQRLAQPMVHDGAVLSAEFSPDGSRVVTASADATARVWNAKTGQPLSVPMKHGEHVISARFSRDGSRILTVSGDGAAWIWEVFTARSVVGPLTSGFVIAARFSPDSAMIVTASKDGAVRIWDAVTGTIRTGPLGRSDTITAVQFSPKGERILTAALDGASIWDAFDAKVPRVLLLHPGALDASFSPDGLKVVTCGLDNAVRVWDAQKGRLIAGPFEHSKSAFLARLSINGGCVLTDGDLAQVCDMRSGQSLFETSSDGLVAAEFSPDASRIATGSLDGVARVWDFSPGEEHCPNWLPTLAEALSGEVLRNDGTLEPTELNRIEVIEKLRQELNHATDQKQWTVWGRWFLSDPEIRTISPFSLITIPQFVKRLIQENNLDTLQEALRLDPTNDVVRRRLAFLKLTKSTEH